MLSAETIISKFLWMMFLVAKLATLGEFLSDCLHHKNKNLYILFKLFSTILIREIFQEQKPDWEATAALSVLRPGGGGEGSDCPDL